MKKHSQWLQYLTALSLTLSGTAFALPSAPAPQGEIRVSQTSAEKLNNMAETVVSAEEQSLEAEWLRVIWAEWVRVIIVVQEQAEAVSQADDFGSYGELLDRVKNEA